MSFWTASGDHPWTHVHHGIAAAFAPFILYAITRWRWGAPLWTVAIWSVAVLAFFVWRESRQKHAKLAAGTWSMQWWRDLVDDLVGPGTATLAILLFTLTWIAL